MKKCFLILLVLALLLTACAAPPPEPTEAPTKPAATEPTESVVTPAPNRVGLAYLSENRYNMFQPDHLSDALEKAGFHCDVRIADGDMGLLETQIREMVDDGIEILIVAETESWLDDDSPFLAAVSEAREAGVTVIGPSGMPWGAPYDYYFAWDVSQYSTQCARWIEDTLDLPNAGDKTYNIEFFYGEVPRNELTWGIYQSAMLILEPYLDAGTLVCRSGQVDFLLNGIPYDSDGYAQERMTGILNDFYRDEPLDVILTDCRDFVDEILAVLESDYTGGQRPLIATTYCVDGDVRRLLSGKTDMCAIGSTDDLRDAVVELCLAIAGGERPSWPGQVSGYDWEDLDHTVLGAPRICTAENAVETLLEFGYYSQEELDRLRSGEDAQ